MVMNSIRWNLLRYIFPNMRFCSCESPICERFAVLKTEVVFSKTLWNRHLIETDARKSSPCAALELRTWEEALTSGTNVHWLIKHWLCLSSSWDTDWEGGYPHPYPKRTKTWFLLNLKNIFLLNVLLEARSQIAVSTLSGLISQISVCLSTLREMV